VVSLWAVASRVRALEALDKTSAGKLDNMKVVDPLPGG